MRKFSLLLVFMIFVPLQADAREYRVSDGKYTVTLQLPDNWAVSADEDKNHFIDSAGKGYSLLVFIMPDEKKSTDAMIGELAQGAANATTILEQPVRGPSAKVSKHDGQVYIWRMGKELSNSAVARTLIVPIKNGPVVFLHQVLFPRVTVAEIAAGEIVMNSVTIKP